MAGTLTASDTAGLVELGFPDESGVWLEIRTLSVYLITT